MSDELRTVGRRKTDGRVTDGYGRFADGLRTDGLRTDTGGRTGGRVTDGYGRMRTDGLRTVYGRVTVGYGRIRTDGRTGGRTGGRTDGSGNNPPISSSTSWVHQNSEVAFPTRHGSAWGTPHELIFMSYYVVYLMSHVS